MSGLFNRPKIWIKLWFPTINKKTYEIITWFTKWLNKVDVVFIYQSQSYVQTKVINLKKKKWSTLYRKWHLLALSTVQAAKTCSYFNLLIRSWPQTSIAQQNVMKILHALLPWPNQQYTYNMVMSIKFHALLPWPNQQYTYNIGWVVTIENLF